jgi:2-oxo-4-hydroxy-4-carboxy-5-ureidoimidazoline decarboxylase
MTIAEFDHLDTAQKRTFLLPCCGSAAWVDKIIAALPAEDLIDLLEIAEDTWYACDKQDWLEAFATHPKIGDLQSLKEKFSSTAQWAEGEQSSVKQASEQTLKELAEGNRQYEEKFGYIFIISAAGKSADDMLGSLKARMNNSPEEELKNAMEEQLKIAKLRLEKLFTT